MDALQAAFLSEWAWRIIPPATSLICLPGLVGSILLVGIARYDSRRHEGDELQPVARFLQRRATGRAIALFLIVSSGILFCIGSWPLPVPPTHGLSLALWINHYAVGSMATLLSCLAILDTRDRMRM